MKHLFLLLLFLFALTKAGAQDFILGQQAKGYMNEKNTSVDHATGVFHYRIPVYTFHSGSYELPVTLDYTATGVKEDDLPGLLGYNWSLNVGGIVARTTRGMNDESGYSPYQTVCEELQAAVNLGYYDGENDIFTAVFNGKSVHFIIRKPHGSDKLEAVPLERTSVRIDYQANAGNGGWVVTDDDGTRYYYCQAEWRKQILKADAVDQGRSKLVDHVSAWYLSRIEPVNAAPIEFIYKEQGSAAHVEESRNYVNYKYGCPMVSYLFDRSQYMLYYEENIEKAQRAFTIMGLEAQTSNPKYVLSNYGVWEKNPTYKVGIAINDQCQRIVGQLKGFSQPAGALSQIINILQSYINQCEKAGGLNANLAASYLKDAQMNLRYCLCDKEKIWGTSNTNMVAYTVYPPVLEYIRCNNYEMQFNNSTGTNGQTQLKSIDLGGLPGNTRLLTTTFSGFQTLSSVSLYDGNLFSFDYYAGIIPFSADLWGYPLKKASNEGTAAFSLKSVTATYGGKVTLEYEPNQAEDNCRPSLPSYINEMGGIRIRSIVSQEPRSLHNDTVVYEYPRPGISVYEDWQNSEFINYGSFSDVVTFSRMRCKGPAYIHTGNNGVYYPYVIEYTLGKGAQAYLFNVPTRDCGRQKTPYAFWLYGLPLATASYDEKHHLRRMTRNTYYTDLSFDTYTLGLMLGDHAAYFAAGDASCKYSSSYKQLAVYEFFMDTDKLKREYERMEVFELGYYMSMNPYKDIYEPNFEVRSRMIVPDLSYDLAYGGATLLKEQMEYLYEGEVTDTISYDDFSRTQDPPYRKTEYFYGNAAHSLLPTRVDETSSGNDLLSTRFWRCTEMQVPVDSTWLKMQHYNLLSPVVKKQVARNGKLSEEQVYQYRFAQNTENKADTTDSVPYMELSGEYLYVPSNPNTLPSEGLAAGNALFTFGRENYRTLRENVYRKINHAYLPVEVRSRRNPDTSVYDATGTTVVLHAKQTDNRFVAAEDMKCKRALEVKKNASDSIWYCSKVIRYFVSKPDWKEQTSYYAGYLDLTFKRLCQLLEILSVPNSPESSTFEAEYLLVMLLEDEKLQMAIKYLQIGTCITPEENADYERMMKRLFDNNDRAYPNIIQYWSWVAEAMPESGPAVVTSFPSSGRMKIYLLTQGGPVLSTDCVVTHAGGETRIPLSCPSSTGYALRAFDIDLASYRSVSSLKMGKEEGVMYAAIVPAGTEFEATSYNPDGTTFATFDQTCQMKAYEYDNFKRVAKVTDGNGNLLEKYVYNTASN